MSINSVTVSGNLGRDPELRSSNSGTSIITFSLAVSERVKRGDDWEDYTNWVDIVVFGKRAESLSRILEKGMKIVVRGRLRYSSWENKEGQRRSKLEVIADDVDIMQRRGDQNGHGGRGGGNSGNYTGGGQNARQNGSQAPTGASYDDGGGTYDDYAMDDIPF